MSMSTISRDAPASPSGKFPRQSTTNNMPDMTSMPTDGHGRSISNFSWSSTGLPDPELIVRRCAAHGPTDPCDCTSTCSPPQFCERSTLEPSTPRRDSDATVSAIFERPSADPHVSPAQLPPLCDEIDSDDELFCATRKQEQEEAVDAWAGLNLLAAAADKVEEWSRTLYQAEVPQSAVETVSVPEEEFTFVPPCVICVSSRYFTHTHTSRSNAPKFPALLHVSSTSTCTEDATVPSPSIHALLLAANQDRHGLNPLAKEKYHPCPATSDEELFESNVDIAAHLTNTYTDPEKSEVKLHNCLLKQYDGADSYASAGAYMQLQVRLLLQQFPRFRADVVTPKDLGPSPALPETTPYKCIVPDCSELLKHTRQDAERHINSHYAGHDPRADIECPLCEDKLQLRSLGRHMFRLHAKEQVARQSARLVECRLCSARMEMMRFTGHFTFCQKAVQRREPPRKKQRTA
ncbi:hypothetical protein C8R43DRAFT_553963 [Mycena crocata]|nr:hypothetical protein C8R43DRAFT_553963 [Mycena crocata]